MPYGLPKSLLWFVATGILFLLQLFPLTGIFLMLVAAPFWSVLLVNAGFASLAVEALLNRRHIYWLIAPALYFGGYAGAAFVSHQQFAQIDASLRAENAAAMVSPSPFDPARHDLIIEKDSYHVSGLASTLVQNYPLAVTYETDKNLKTAGHVAFRVAQPEACKSIRRNRSARDARVYVTFIPNSRRGEPRACTVRGPEDPQRPATRISLKHVRTKGGLLPVTYDTLTLHHADGITQTLRTGSAGPLSWLPMPTIGCFLNSGAPSWDCSASFVRWRRKGLARDGGYGRANAPVIAAALGLAEIPLAAQKENASAELPATLRDTIEKRLQISSANLDRIISDPTTRLTIHDIAGLHERQDLWRDRIPAMVSTLERAFDAGYEARERALMLQDLLNKLPASDYDAVSGRILQALADRPGLEDRFLRDPTLTRLGDLGASALPVLEARLFRTRGRVNSGALLGVCRIGSAAAHLATQIADHIDRTDKYISQDTRFAAYLTLHRLGHASLAPQVLTEKQMPSQHVLDAVSESVNPASSAGVCVNQNEWRRRTRRSRS